jgi:hypothetical protein
MALSFVSNGQPAPLRTVPDFRGHTAVETPVKAHRNFYSKPNDLERFQIVEAVLKKKRPAGFAAGKLRIRHAGHRLAKSPL